MRKHTQRNCLGILGLGSLGATIGLATTGNIEYAVMAAAIAPTCFGLRSDIFSPENTRILEDAERNIYNSIDETTRIIDRNENEMIRTIDRIELEFDRRIDDTERNFSEEINQRG